MRYSLVLASVGSALRALRSADTGDPLWDSISCLPDRLVAGNGVISRRSTLPRSDRAAAVLSSSVANVIWLPR